MSELAHLLPAGGLTDDEANFVYNVEVLDLPVKKAAQLAGVPASKAVAPHIVQAREIVRNKLRGDLSVTKEDATYGIKEAINRAKIIGDPMVEIAGWDRLIKLHGLDAPQKVDINIKASIDVLSKQVRSMSDSELVKALGVDSIIDAEFYEVRSPD